MSVNKVRPVKAQALIGQGSFRGRSLGRAGVCMEGAEGLHSPGWREGSAVQWHSPGLVQRRPAWRPEERQDAAWRSQPDFPFSKANLTKLTQSRGSSVFIFQLSSLARTPAFSFPPWGFWWPGELLEQPSNLRLSGLLLLLCSYLFTVPSLRDTFSVCLSLFFF